MKRIAIAIVLACVCTSAFAQRPDGASSKSPHRPLTGGASASTVQGQTRAGTTLIQQGASSRGVGRTPLDAAASSTHGYGNASLAQRGSSIRANSMRGTRKPLAKQSKQVDDSGQVRVKPPSANQRARENAGKLTGHERALQVQLATADRMRDRAIETGDVKMLERADEFEQKARARFAELSEPSESTAANDFLDAQEPAQSNDSIPDAPTNDGGDDN